MLLSIGAILNIWLHISKQISKEPKMLGHTHFTWSYTAWDETIPHNNCGLSKSNLCYKHGRLPSRCWSRESGTPKTIWTMAITMVTSHNLKVRYFLWKHHTFKTWDLEKFSWDWTKIFLPEDQLYSIGRCYRSCEGRKANNNSTRCKVYEPQQLVHQDIPNGAIVTRYSWR